MAVRVQLSTRRRGSQRLRPARHKHSLTIKSGQCHVQRYMRPLLERIEKGEIDPSFVITHTMRLDDAPQGYRIFRDKLEECEKVVLKP